jgi:hypothetical protein
VGEDDRDRAEELFARIIEDKEKLYPEWREARLRLGSRPDVVELERPVKGAEKLDAVIEKGEVTDGQTDRGSDSSVSGRSDVQTRRTAREHQQIETHNEKFRKGYGWGTADPSDTGTR